MIRCKPRGICSWNFELTGEGHTATLEFNWFSEQGTIVVDGTPHEVDKGGVFSGAWQLIQGAESIASAQKSSAFTRTFELETSIGPLLLKAESIFKRTFELEQNGQRIATIAADHAFTRRATIETHGEVDFRTLAFAFWLAVLMWRRAQSNNSAAGAS